jgi:DNA modification methylase
MRLVNQDCVEYLKAMDDSSIDLVVVDPPYFGILNEKWDNQWPTEQAYLSWCNIWTNECVRVLKPNRCLYVWGTTKTDTFIKYKLDVLNSHYELSYQNWIVWSYDWGGRSNKSFARKHEDCLMYSKGKDFMFNADDVRIPYKMDVNIRETANNHPLGKIPTDVWEKNNHTTSKEYVDWHPTQKPLLLLERIIKANSNEGDLVMDCFSGSGSTAIASYNTNRMFTGCELNTTYYNKSIERINAWRDGKLDFMGI